MDDAARLPRNASPLRILVVGGHDVDRRMALLDRLSRHHVGAVGSDRALARRFERQGIEYLYFPLKRGFGPVSDLVSLVWLTALFRRWKPDVVHGFATKPSILGRIAGRLAGVRAVVGTVPGLGSLYVVRGPLARVSRILFDLGQRVAGRCSDATVFQNQEDAREFMQSGLVGREGAALIPGSGVDTKYYAPDSIPPEARRSIREELGVDEGALVVTMITRVIRSKGVMDFAAAARSLSSRYPGVSFVLVGPDDQVSVEALSDEERVLLRSSLNWIGQRDDVREILSATDVFVLPTYYREGIPRALLEAASMGLPLVATRAPGCVEVVVDGVNGLLVPMRRPDHVANALSRLVEDSELRTGMGSESRRIAVEKFDIDVIARLTEELYTRLVRHGQIPASLRAREREVSAGGAGSDWETEGVFGPRTDAIDPNHGNFGSPAGIRRDQPRGTRGTPA